MENLGQIHLIEIDKVLEQVRKELIDARGVVDRQDVANALGIHASTALRWERGTFRMSMKNYLKLCSLYKLDPVLTFQKAVLTVRLGMQS